MLTLLLACVGGGIGAVIRGGITEICINKFPSQFPIATFIANIIGSLLIGITLGHALQISWINPFLVTGILGGLTTFSTLASEFVKMIESKTNLPLFISYSILQYGGCFVACLIGYKLF
ncbi:CrcB family protein [Staphylococcus lloydii]|uniref:fluoride efflux transporter FluC n=1 Tax=Staphylococcus lloydii TaxID=2781774 RepID=UPI002928BBFE|nr:CrcB family protein [Staphylococcus lloydii]MDU9418004.1 CrcB family protein [Staphylococcus lloydii]